QMRPLSARQQRFLPTGRDGLIELACAGDLKRYLPSDRLAPACRMGHPVCMVSDERPAPEQIEIYRRMTPQERLQAAERLYWRARKVKAAELRHQHPDFDEEQVQAEVRRIFLEAALQEEIGRAHV